MTRFSTLGQLDLDHFHLFKVGLCLKQFIREVSVIRSATEVSCANLPNQICATFHMIRTDATFTCVMGKVSLLGTGAQGENCILAKGAIAHRRNIQQAGRVGLCTVRTTDVHSHVLGRIVNWSHRVVDPLVAHFIHVFLGSEWDCVTHILGALINQRPGIAIEGNTSGIAFDKVLVDLGTNEFK